MRVKWAPELHALLRLPDQFLLCGCVCVFPLNHLTAHRINHHLVEKVSPLLWPNRQEGTGGQEAAADSWNLSAAAAAAAVVNFQRISHTGRKYCTLQRVHWNQTESVSHVQANEMNNLHCEIFLKYIKWDGIAWLCGENSFPTTWTATWNPVIHLHVC